ncbi:hypothetical protein O4H66_10300 [Comamonadaceae bacterium G21597-S1]|nr:hypothetical protein [Comamonadaceae bacterium G21597-S1]
MGRVLFQWSLGVGCFALALEILFRVLPVSTSTASGYYVDPVILSYPPHHRWTMATGWDLRNAQHLESNNYGFVSANDFVRDSQSVALIGDSFVEASMLEPNDRPGAQLESQLRSRTVFTLGAPGSALLDYAERIRLVHQQFETENFVILMERSDVRQSICGSGNVHGPCIDAATLQPELQIKAAPDLAKRLLRNSALAQYLISQLKLDPAALVAELAQLTRSVFSSDPGSPRTQGDVRTTPARDTLASSHAVTQLFFDRVKPYLGKGRLIFVVDCDRSAVYAGNVAVDPERTRFIQAARAMGATVIDLEPLFVQHYKSSPLKFDVGPYDGHLNALGVRIAMTAAAKELAQSR